MVKREHIKKGTQIMVMREMPKGSFPGPLLTKQLQVGSTLQIEGTPFNKDGMNLVPAVRSSDGERVELMLTYVMFFCKE